MTSAELQALARLWCRANGQAEVNVAKTLRRLELRILADLLQKR